MCKTQQTNKKKKTCKKKKKKKKIMNFFRDYGRLQGPTVHFFPFTK